jgi:hypothetical protein
MDRFEEWTRIEIGRLRAEADALERTLNRFLSSQSNDPRSLISIEPKLVGMPTAPFRKRRSKNDAILEVLDQAGPYGLSMDDLMKAAKQVGITPNRNAIRAFCWNEKQKGRLFQPSAGRFASARFERDEAAGPAPSGSPAASVPSTPNDAERRGEVAHDNIDR